MRYLGPLFGMVASCASILGLYFTLYPTSAPRPVWHYYFLAPFIIINVILIINELLSTSRERHKKFWSTSRVNKYMSDYISHPGRTVVFSRDLSWGSDAKAKSALLNKARGGDLTIYLHAKTGLSDELEKAGARVVIYGAANHMPRSRFTIVGFGKEGGRLAVGTTRRGKPVVYEFESGEDPVYALAEDLSNLVSGFSQ